MHRSMLGICALVALAVAGAGAGPVGAAAQPVCNGTVYTGPATGQVDIAPKVPIAAGHEVGLSAGPLRGGGLVDGSGSFEIDGPGGHESIPNPGDGSVAWTPKFVGHYTIAAKWRQYVCEAGANSTFA